MQYLGVNPLEWDELPYYWRQRALLALTTENSVEKELMDRASRGAH